MIDISYSGGSNLRGKNQKYKSCSFHIPKILNELGIG